VARPNILPKLPALTPDEYSLDNTPQRISLPPSRRNFAGGRPIHLRNITDPIRPPITLKPISQSRPQQPPTLALENAVARCAFKTRTGTVRGKPKKQNQDSYIIIPVFGGHKGQYLFSVCDGHGQKGHEVSSLVKEVLPGLIEARVKKLGTDMEEVDFQIREDLNDAIQEMNLRLTYSNIEVAFSGTTCVTVLARDRQLWCANVGDSRAVIAQRHQGNWEALDLSKDHKPESPGEHQRIVMAGGRVEPYKDLDGKPLGPHRVWLKHESLPGLAMSRSLGDGVAHSVGVISTANVLHHYIGPNDLFMIIASDGLWEFLSSQEAVLIVSQGYLSHDYQGCCDSLMSESLLRWRSNDEVIDDITIIVVFFKCN
jgi:serine/threonine protein phosphatase PrpC